MIKRKQLFVHSPPHSIGDCQRTAIACILDMEPHEVPHFGEGMFKADPTGEGEEFERRLQTWLATQGLTMVNLAIPGEFGVEGVCNIFKGVNEGTIFLLGGRSSRGTNHVVVADGSGVIWDPSYEAVDGEPPIVGPMDDGHFWASLMVSIKHKP